MVSLTCVRRRCTQDAEVAQTTSLRGELLVSRRMVKLGQAEDLVGGSTIEEHAHDLHKVLSAI